MKSDFSSNYARNYIFQILATGVGLLSLFIVVPFLSSNKALYGIYSICVSLSVFFNYADLGFVSASQKYAAEKYATDNLKEEIQIIGFTFFILFWFIVLIALCLIPFCIKPELLISQISCENSIIATELLSILILSAPFIALRRICYVVYIIRVEQYRYQSVTFLAHIIKIVSVLFFFTGSHYNIVAYYGFVQLLDVFVTIYLVCKIRSIYNYSIKEFIRSFRFDIKIFNQLKGLGLATMINTICWILFYELDMILLAKISNPTVVALYSSAFTLLTLLRNYLSILYSSFNVRYNHFVALNKREELVNFYKKNIAYLFPFVSIPIIIFTISGGGLVLSWIGSDYYDTILLAKVLILGNLFAFLSYPSSSLFVALNAKRAIIKTSVLLDVLFYCELLLLWNKFGVVAFSISKSVALLTIAVMSFYLAIKILKISPWLIIKLLNKNIISIAITVAISFAITLFMKNEKDVICLALNIMYMGVAYVLCFISCYLTNGDVRFFVSKYKERFRNRGI